MHHDRAHPGPTMPAPKTDEAYRGYLIRTNALSNTMWIEQGGQLVHRVPADKSWAYARNIIDGLLMTQEMETHGNGPDAPGA